METKLTEPVYMDKLVTVLTTTYNRVNTLTKLYKSLISQTDKRFKWVIVDDGSTDGTEDLIAAFSGIEIKYIKQNNSGKHVALNTGIKIIDSELTFIVDSDDYLTDDAIELINRYWNKYEQDKNKICGISFNRGYSKVDTIGDRLPFSEKIDNFINVRLRLNIQGDKAEVWRTECLKEYPFIEIEGEKFLGETYVWWQLAMKYDMLFVNEIIYIGEYLEGGLTKSGRSLRVKNPIGGIKHYEIGLNKVFPLKFRLKHGILYTCYSFFAKYKLNEILKNTKYKVLVSISLLPGWILYKYWNKNYI